MSGARRSGTVGLREGADGARHARALRMRSASVWVSVAGAAPITSSSRGGAPSLPARCLLEALGVEARGVGRQAHLPVIGRDAALPRETAQQLERHAQRPPGVLLGLVPPEEADQVLPRASALWGPCQV